MTSAVRLRRCCCDTSTIPGDWRDIEALQALGTPRALEAVQAAANHRNPEVRKAALRELVEPGEKTEESLEDSVVRSLNDACSLGGLAALDIAQQCPTPRVKKALLDCARLGSPEVRVNAAAMLLYVCGQAKEPFDWEQRPFFLQFRTENSRELRVCWEELRKRAGI
jgi:hypothetical protein